MSSGIAFPDGKASRVIVIGGGLSGIAASLSLADSGFQVTLVEAKARLGGRVGSFEDSQSGQAIDYCQHVGMACCTNLVKFLELMSIAGEWERQETLHFFSQHGTHMPLRAALLPAPLHLSGLLLRWPDLAWSDRIRIAWALFRLMRLKPSAEHDEILAVDWLRSTAQSPKTIAKFWATILVSALGEQVDRVTLQATRKVLIDGFAANRSAYHLLIPKQKLSTLVGVQAEKALIARGVTTRLASPVKHVRWHKNGSPRVELSNRQTLDADLVVIAVPWHQIQRLFSDVSNETPQAIQDWRDRMTALESAPITGVHTWWDQPWLKQPHAILIDRLCQWVFGNATQTSPTQDDYYYQIVISGSRNLPRGDTQAALDAVVADLQSIFPAAAQSRMLRGKLVTDPHSVFSVAKGNQSARPRCDLFAEHGLWLCGDWTDTQWPATMEGAIRSGFAVTEGITGRCGSPRRWIADDLPRGWLARSLIRS
jgi:squalene-associated FAD-dependent desaturase